MKLGNVKKLYLVKQTIIKLDLPVETKNRLIQAVNSVLLDEGGVGAVLYPNNSPDQQILHFWSEGMNPEDIAKKLCLYW
jgi:hypothetical protein